MQPSVQWTDVLDTLRRIERTSPFYRQKLGAAGIRAADVRTLDDFRRVPLTRKPEVPAAQKAAPPFGSLLAVPAERIATVHVSPGPLYIPRTAEEPTGVEALHESLQAMGIRRADVAHVTLSYHIMPGGLRLHRAFETYGCRVINGGVGNSELQVRVASDLGATVYVGTPSFLANLADVAATLQLPLTYRLGFSTAETLTPQLRRDMHARLGIELFNHCGEALIGPLAGECRQHDGMHLHQREMWIEFLDPDTGEPVPPGGVGELVVTQLGERAMPLVRYAPGDLYRTWAEPCPCGDSAPRVDIVGQVGSIRKIRGVLVHPAQVQETLRAFPELGRFQITIDHTANDRYDHAVIRIGCNETIDRSGLAARVRERLRASIMLQLDVELVPQGEVPESAGPPRFVDAFIDRRAK
jgi:phenylacetate-CoA ligase